MYEFNAKNREDFLCIADQIVFEKKGIDVFCDSAPHHKDLAPAYFKNKLIVSLDTIYTISLFFIMFLIILLKIFVTLDFSYFKT